MSKLEELNTTEKLVKDILLKESHTRNSDNALYIEVVRRLNENALHKPFYKVMLNLNDLGLPCFETVRRTRAKIQAEHPELQSDVRILKAKEENQKDFEEYARS